MQGPSSFKGALHPFHSTSESKHLKWMGYPSVTAGLAGHLSSVRLCRQLLHKQHFCHWNIAHFPTGCSKASFKKLCDSSSQVLTHQNMNIQHGFIGHTTLGLIKGQPTKDSWGHWLDSTDHHLIQPGSGGCGSWFPCSPTAFLWRGRGTKDHFWLLWNELAPMGVINDHLIDLPC